MTRDVRAAIEIESSRLSYVTKGDGGGHPGGVRDGTLSLEAGLSWLSSRGRAAGADRVRQELGPAFGSTESSGMMLVIHPAEVTSFVSTVREGLTEEVRSERLLREARMLQEGRQRLLAVAPLVGRDEAGYPVHAMAAAESDWTELLTAFEAVGRLDAVVAAPVAVATLLRRFRRSESDENVLMMAVGIYDGYTEYAVEGPDGISAVHAAPTRFDADRVYHAVDVLERAGYGTEQAPMIWLYGHTSESTTNAFRQLMPVALVSSILEPLLGSALSVERIGRLVPALCGIF